MMAFRMQRRLLGWVGAAALTGLLLAGPATAQISAIPPVAQEELYLEAMHSLAEGHQEEASALLMRFLEQEPLHAGAWLDLAISQCELGHASEAERLFHEIELRFAPPPGIMEVIATYRARGCTVTTVQRRQLALTLGRGHDSNINQGADNRFFNTGSGINLVQWELAPTYLPQPDYYTSLAGDYIEALDDQGTLAITQLRARAADTVSSQDTISLMLGLQRPWQLGNWRGLGTVAVGAVRLGGELYQRQAQLQLRVSPPFNLPEHFDWSATGSLVHVQYPTQVHFDGTTLDLGTTLDYHDYWGQVQSTIGLLEDHGNAERLGGDRQGWYGGVQLHTRLTDQLAGELGLTRQSWRSDAVYSPGLIDVKRDQDTSLLRAALILPLRPHHTLLLEYRQVTNRENIPLFQYNSRLIQVSWRWDNF